MNICITGVSGTGKTTVGRNLKKSGYSVIDIDEDKLCVWKEKKHGTVVDYEATLDKEFIDTHEWVCDIQRLLKKNRRRKFRDKTKIGRMKYQNCGSIEPQFWYFIQTIVICTYIIRKKMLAVPSFYGEKQTPERTTTVCLSHMRNA